MIARPTALFAGAFTLALLSAPPAQSAELGAQAAPPRAFHLAASPRRADALAETRERLDRRMRDMDAPLSGGAPVGEPYVSNEAPVNPADKVLPGAPAVTGAQERTRPTARTQGEETA